MAKRRSELAHAMQVNRIQHPYIIKNPAGTYMFVGKVDSRLAYICEDGNTPTDEQIDKIARSGFPGMVKKAEHILTRTFKTAEDAGKAAQTLGISYFDESNNLIAA
jgi:hypothetical protein